jgi:hypothetical protein
LLAVQESALLLDQVKVVCCPAVTVVGLAAKLTVGAGVAAVTEILVEALAEPPALVHDNE